MKKYLVIFLLGLSLSVSGEGLIKTDTLSFSFGGKKLTGLLDQPADKKPAGLVILIPGSGKTNMIAGGWYYRSLRHFFAGQGWACYVWDKQGCGRSEGDYDDRQAIRNSAQEAIAAIEELKRLNIPGSDKIGLWGLSRGGWVCPYIIADYPSISFWISVSGPDSEENTPYLLETNFRIEGKSEAQTQLLVSEWKNGNDRFRKGEPFEAYQKATENLRRDSFWLAISGQQYTKEGYERTQKTFREQNHPFNEKTGLRIYMPGFDTILGNIKCPVLAIFGEKDSQVDWQKTMALYKANIGNDQQSIYTVMTFPDGNHNLFRCRTGGMKEKLDKVEFCDAYFETMAAWLQKQM